jgi:TonB family protein
MLKTAFCIAVFYLVYSTLFSRDTMYERNRILILLSLVASFVFPFIVLETLHPNNLQFFGKDLTGITVNGNIGPSTSESASINWSRILLIIYLAGVIVTGIRLLAEILNLSFLIAKQKNGKSNIIRLNKQTASGFSAFGHIFINNAIKPDDAEEIIRHEQKHLDSRHFVDILFTEIIKVIQWFNPFIYMIDKSLREVHEFQADEECLSSGIPVRNYQGLLLNQVFRTSVFNISNSFSNPTLIKKRMIMMTKRRSKSLANLKILLVLPALILLLISFSTCAVKKKSATAVVVKEAALATDVEPEPFVVVEEMPMFPGGDSLLLKYIAENIKYPEAAKTKGIQGRVIIRFCITATGAVNKVSVLRGVDADLDAEAIRVVSSLPEFKPGKQGGKPVPVWYMVPITFALDGKVNKDNIPKPSTSIMPPPPPPPPYTSDKDGEGYTKVDQMPQFPGGDAGLMKFIGENTRYPKDAKDGNITGMVITRFLVRKDGKVSDVSVQKGVSPSLDAEAVRVISILPAFEKPGIKDGKPVAVWYMVPITFSLK